MNLVKMYGDAPAMGQQLVEINPLELDDVDAGILFLSNMVRQNPGVKWKDLIPLQVSGMLDDFGKWLGTKGRETGNLIGDVVDWSGESFGDAVRLFTDEDVQEGVMRYGTAYVTGGKSEALRSFMGPGQTQQSGIALADMGSAYKQNYGMSIPPAVWWIGGGIGGLMLLMTMVMAMRR